MRFACALLVAGLSLRAAAEEFPYTAEVAHEAALVRSGPGESYYPTSRVVRGAVVEVYRHDPHGWCAIRPPEGEFSLIEAERLKLLPGDDLAEVVGQEAKAWVGSHITEPEEHRWQIHVQPGERVVVLGVRAGDANDPDGAFWCRIAPPAGEFRWIHRDVLSQAEALAATTNDSAPVAVAEQVRSPAEAIDSPSVELGLADVAPRPLQPPAEAPFPGAGTLPGPAGGDLPVQPVSLPQTIAPYPPAAAPTLVEADRVAAFTPREMAAPEEVMLAGGSAPIPFREELRAINIDLALTVARDLTRWRLGPLQERAARLVDVAETDDDYREAVKLLEAIRRFEHLYQRYRANMGHSLRE
jgi:hypothetical protein